ncbi:DnaJ domain-containing protein [Campylobacter mucosalis]|uniref:DnaJ domain-containing protein n=1 Tax=Campylobacter mucosalis TaxID=202 RepID=UPI0004D97E06|nr:DnaJ domain-containing protein [Campylobacter mucosalis]KEA45487.1 molecular chaperone DnaJ [Campylobacter mucosalis]QKF63346.1 DnaJ-like membrane chaperone protein [Campylobacter mucosalis]
MGSIIFYAVVFYVIYWIFSKFNAQNGVNSEFKRQLSQDEAKFLVALLAKVAKGDGRVNELEAELISQTLSNMAYKTGVSRELLKDIYNTEKQNISDTYELAREYATKFRLDTQTAIARLTFFLNLAYIDGEFNSGERAVINDIARGFGISQMLLNSVIFRFEAFYSQRQKSYQNSKNQSFATKKDPYAVLEISKDASFSEIKRKYRELVKKYHPDILMGQGESESVIEKSTKKLQEINEAYEKIKNERGEK